MFALFYVYIGRRVSTDPDFGKNVAGVLIEAEAFKDKLKGLYNHNFLVIGSIRNISCVYFL